MQTERRVDDGIGGCDVREGGGGCHGVMLLAADNADGDGSAQRSVD